MTQWRTFAPSFPSIVMSSIWHYYSLLSSRLKKCSANRDTELPKVRPVIVGFLCLTFHSISWLFFRHRNFRFLVSSRQKYIYCINIHILLLQIKSHSPFQKISLINSQTDSEYGLTSSDCFSFLRKLYSFKHFGRLYWCIKAVNPLLSLQVHLLVLRDCNKNFDTF